MRECDLVVIPSDVGRSDKAGIERKPQSIRVAARGRFAVAHPLPAYREFAGYAQLGHDIVQGMEWAVTHPDEAVERVRAGQAYVGERYAPAALGRQWEDALRRAIGRPG